MLLLAGASGSGKTTLVRRILARHELPVVPLDDFYRSGDDPDLPGRQGLVDWDSPASWAAEEATSALARLVEEGRVEVPTYDIPSSRRTGTATVLARPGSLVLAEGIFAPYLVQPLRELGLLADAVHLPSRPAVTFARRLLRDLAEGRKPPLTLLRRGIRLARSEPALLRRWEELGTRPVPKAGVVALVDRLTRQPVTA